MDRELDRAQEALRSAAKRLSHLSGGGGRQEEDYKTSAALHVARLEWSIALGRVMALQMKGHSHDSWD
jgi:hypothetical protein